MVADAARRVRERIASAGGDPERVTLVAVTKGHPASAVTAALAAGLDTVAESYAQELVAKAGALDPGASPRWHFVGRLQRNKVRSLAPHVALWQSVDRLSVAAEVAARAPGATVLVQVNASGEPQKGGCRPEMLPAVVDGCRDLGLDVAGLMAVGVQDDPDATRGAFRLTRELADRFGLPERSMGMSDDLEVAVEEGSTMVRVGTALFGPRPGAATVRH